MAQDPLVGTVLDGKYEITGVIGQGGMGVVYRGRQISMGRRPVAIKVLKRERAHDARAVNRFRKEIEAISRLNHPNAVTVYDCGHTEDSLLYIVMERLKGRPLSKVIKTEAPLPLARARHILDQVCDVLAQAHAGGVIHRDLKPANIILVDNEAGEDQIKVVDFGIAKVLAPPGDLTPTETGRILGTAGYISPELVRSESPDPRSDLYALGVILFEMLVGRRPYKGKSLVATVMMHIEAEIPSLVERLGRTPETEALDPFLRRAMAKTPDERPRDAVAFKQELATACARASSARPEQVLEEWQEQELTETAPAATLTIHREALAEPGKEVSATQRLPALKGAPQRRQRSAVLLLAVALGLLALLGGGYLLCRAAEADLGPGAAGSAPAVVGVAPVAASALPAEGVAPAAAAPSPDAGAEDTAPSAGAAPAAAAPQQREDAGAAADRPVAPDTALDSEDLGSARTAKAARRTRGARARAATERSRAASAVASVEQSDARTSYARANQLILKDRCAAAVPWLKTTLDQDPAFADAHRALGLCYGRLGKSSLSIRHYERYLKARPSAQDAAQVREILRRSRAQPGADSE